MVDEVVSPTILKWVYAFILVLGVGFYFAWGFAYNAFFDLANYTVSVLLVGAGLVGTFLYRELEREKAAGRAAK